MNIPSGYLACMTSWMQECGNINCDREYQKRFRGGELVRGNKVGCLGHAEFEVSVK